MQASSQQLYSWTLLLAVSLMGLTSCQAADPDLAQASEAMAAMATRKHLSRSCFYVVYPQGQASEYVNYLFSSLGAGEWPTALDPEEAAAIRVTLLPDNVRVSPLQRQHLEKKELVLSADDQQGIIQAKGYLPDQTNPSFESQWSLGSATPSPLAQAACENAIDIGISPISVNEDTD